MLLHLVGFLLKLNYDARIHELKKLRLVVKRYNLRKSSCSLTNVFRKFLTFFLLTLQRSVTQVTTYATNRYLPHEAHL
jgi:hypothetical protein